MKDHEPLWHEFRLNKGYYYGPGAGRAREGLPIQWGQVEPVLTIPMESSDSPSARSEEEP